MAAIYSSCFKNIKHQSVFFSLQTIILGSLDDTGNIFMLMAQKKKYLWETKTNVKLQKLLSAPPVNAVNVLKYLDMI